jgi:hypothetical protein
MEEQSVVSQVATRAFVDEVLRTGFMLIDVLSTLIKGVGEQTGEESAELVVGCLAGSLVPVVEAAGPECVDHCTALLGALADKTRDDLHRALEIAREREGTSD